jgi:23S rRNA (guanine1835-N2)-methyltransferase
MLSPFLINDKNIALDRFPIAQVNRSLQAWDAADEYLINHITAQNLINAEDKILLCNDAFGALACNLTGHNIVSLSDSYLSHQGTRYNLKQNNSAQNNLEQVSPEQNEQPQENLTLLTSLDDLPKDITLVLFKIPKSKSLLIEQLIKIKSSLSKDIVFIAADRAKEIHSSTLKVFEKYLGSTTTSLAVKKARLVFCQLDNKTKNNSPFPTIWPIVNDAEYSQNKEFIISNHANVYSREKLDIGGRYFIENLPKVSPNSKVIDLGCGNGVIGLTILSRQPEAYVHFIDESYMAMASAKMNIENNLPERVTQCIFQVNDCLTEIESHSVDLILCNPPFHQQTATTDHIAWQMFNDSYRVLKKGGELRIIGNRQLGYHIKIKRIFGNEKLVASNDKFVTLSAIKR